MALERLPNLVISDSAGSSETGAQMHATSVDGVDVGKFLPGPGAVVVDETLAHVLEPGHEGNGWLAQTGSVPLGYLGDAAKTARTFPVIGGVRYSIPGDRARHLANGEIELLGRDSVTVNSGGEKIFVEEVERAIAGHPAVADVVVAGRPSERWGSEVVAVVQVAEGASTDQASIVDHASAHIARYKLPKEVVFVQQIQRSPSGKADYRWAAETAIKAQGEQPAALNESTGPRIVTERLVLRPFTDVDRAPFAELNAHPAGGRDRWAESPSRAESDAMSDASARSWHARAGGSGPSRWRAAQPFVGMVGLHRVHADAAVRSGLSRSAGASTRTTGGTATPPRRRRPHCASASTRPTSDEIVAFTTTLNTRSQAVMAAHRHGARPERRLRPPAPGRRQPAAAPCALPGHGVTSGAPTVAP